jgi:Ala-tRNA(Pro) deacylase
LLKRFPEIIIQLIFGSNSGKPLNESLLEFEYRFTKILLQEAKMPSEILKKFLDENNVKYLSVRHSSAYTAQEIAAAAHVPGKELAKTVIIKADGKMVMAVLPASYKVSFDNLKEALGVNEVRLAYEQEFLDKFPDCEVGAMPPFGNLYGMDVYVAESLTNQEEITFNACSHTELIKMKFEDFNKLVKPKKIKFSTPTKV